MADVSVAAELRSDGTIAFTASHPTWLNKSRVVRIEATRRTADDWARFMIGLMDTEAASSITVGDTVVRAEDDYIHFFRAGRSTVYLPRPQTIAALAPLLFYLASRGAERGDATAPAEGGR